MVKKTIDSYAPRGISANFVRGIDEDFEAADPTVPMEDFSLFEVALAYKQSAIVKELMEVYKYPVISRKYAKADEQSSTSIRQHEDVVKECLPLQICC